MKEFLLSFDNIQQKRQKELFMEYKTYSIQKQYLFVYQRDGISLDVEYFKDLVSFSKKPTRSSLLYLEWVSNPIPIRLDNGFINIKSIKPFMFLPISTLAKLTMSKNTVFFNQSYEFKIISRQYTAEFKSFLIEPKNKINVNIQKNLLLNDLKTNKTKIFQNNFYFKDSKLNYFKNDTIKSLHGKIASMFENVITQTDHERFLNKFDILFLYNAYTLNKFDNLSLSTSIKSITNLKPEDMLYKEKAKGSIIHPFFAKNTNNILHIRYFNETILGLPYKNILNYYENDYAFRKLTFWNIYENINAYNSGSNRVLNTFNNDHIQRKNIVTNKFENVYITNLPIIISEYKTDALRPLRQRIANILYGVHSLVYKELPYNLYNNENLLTDRIDVIHMQYFNDDSLLEKYAKYIHSFEVINGRKPYQSIDVYENNNAERFIDYNLVTFPNDMSYKHYNYVYTQDNKNFLVKDINRLSVFNDYNILLKQYFSELSTYHGESFADIIYKGISIFDTIHSLYKANNDMFLNPYVYGASASYINVAWFNKQFYLEKMNLENALFDTNIGLTKYSSYGLKAIYENVFLNKYNNGLQYSNDILSFETLLSEMFAIENDNTMKKFIYNLFIENESISLLREYKNAMFEDDYLYELAKEYLPAMIQSNYDKILISLNKINQTLFTADLLQSITKRRRDVFSDASTNTIFTDKLVRNIFTIDNLVCDKLSSDVTFSNLINENIFRKQVQTWFLNKDIFINKYSNDINLTSNDINIIKIMPKILLSDQQAIFKKVRNIFEHDIILPFTKFYTVDELSQGEWFTMIKHVFLSQHEMDIYKKYRDVSNTQDERFLERPNSNLDIIPESGKHLSIERLMHLDQMKQITRINNFPVTFYDQLFLTRDTLLSDIFPNVRELAKIVKEINISSDDTLNWAWVYQEDEPFDDPFKIDELLLPENDSRYEDFENIIFNKETGKPRDPVQIIDDYTFIAKYPIHYPIKDEDGENAYKNIAVEYLDVRTNIMKKVFLGYYQLWQDHIFEFSRMTIPQSAKKILDYLYAWILMSFAEEDIPEALRTFRLVRWYLERGIIETSEYCIKFEPGDIECKMLTTQLEIPCDLYPTDGSTPNNSMFVDTNLHIIRNDPNKLRQEAHFTMYIDNKRDTLVSFDLHTLTPVYIILNEGLDNETILDSITIPTTGKMVYNIPYTGDVNKLTIKKHAIDNNDNEFYIGHIIIPGLNNKDAKLDIEFNPSKIQGNKVLNHVSQKVLAYTNMINDNEHIIQELVKGNIHLGEVYEHLLEYWELHHQNKDKGKRLTIKRT